MNRLVLVLVLLGSFVRAEAQLCQPVLGPVPHGAAARRCRTALNHLCKRVCRRYPGTKLCATACDGYGCDAVNTFEACDSATTATCNGITIDCLVRHIPDPDVLFCPVYELETACGLTGLRWSP
jgi:hypothetical protein